jgi:hypothetical protein
LLSQAEEDLAEGVLLLQRAQEVDWCSVAGRVMRDELYGAIQVLRSLDGEIAAARRELALLAITVDEHGPVAA